MSTLPRFALVLGLATAAVAVHAQPASDQFEVRINIQSACAIDAQDLNFGSHGLLAADITATSQISVLCTNTTPYSVGLDLGSSGERHMLGGDGSVAYDLFRDSAHAQPWGTAGGSTAAGTGTGQPQPLTVYGRVSAQASAAPGDYVDTVTATVSF